MGRVIVALFPSGACTGYTYDAAGNRKQYVSASSTAPTAVNVAMTTYLNVAISFDPRLNNPSCQSQTVTGVGSASHGTTAIMSGGGGITYTPTTSYTGSDSFTYTLTNATGSVAGTVAMNVNTPTLPPVATNGQMFQIFQIIPPATSVTPVLSLNVTTIANSPYGYQISVSAFTQPAHATVTLSGTTLTYTWPNPIMSNKDVGDAFNYTVSDGQGHTASATISIVFTVSNDH